MCVAAPAAGIADGYSANEAFEKSPSASPADQTRLWAAMSGSTLKDTLETWAQAAGWKVVWDTETNYGLRASATFAGTFVTAVTDIVDTIHLNNPELTVTMYTGNRVVHVQTLLNETR